MDGPNEDGKFSNDFNIVQTVPTCSLLVVDRGNAAPYQIYLSEKDCDRPQDSPSAIGLVYLDYG